VKKVLRRSAISGTSPDAVGGKINHLIDDSETKEQNIQSFGRSK
jgi:hypothetical protein